MKRIILFVLTNIAVIAMLSIVTSLLGVNRYLTAHGINYQSLLIFASVIGFGGAFISLAISKLMAKWTMNLHMIGANSSGREQWLYQTIARQSHQAGIAMPEVAIYESPELNAFATGPSRNNALVAVSTGLLSSMRESEVEAVLGHEVSHIANGDMVTQTLLQGILNTFVIFGARVVAFFIDQWLSNKDDSEEATTTTGIGYMITSFILEIVFGLIASMIVAWFSRYREYRADQGGAQLGSKLGMINALKRLGGQEQDLPGGLNAFGISGKTHQFLDLFASHPPIEKRIEALSK